jgi:hypothetical protein
MPTVTVPRVRDVRLAADSPRDVLLMVRGLAALYRREVGSAAGPTAEGRALETRCWNSLLGRSPGWTYEHRVHDAWRSIGAVLSEAPPAGDAPVDADELAAIWCAWCSAVAPGSRVRVALTCDRRGAAYPYLLLPEDFPVAEVRSACVASSAFPGELVLDVFRVSGNRHVSVDFYGGPSTTVVDAGP